MGRAPVANSNKSKVDCRNRNEVERGRAFYIVLFLYKLLFHLDCAGEKTYRDTLAT